MLTRVVGRMAVRRMARAGRTKARRAPRVRAHVPRLSRIAVLLAFVALSSTPVQAEEEGYGDPGLYIGAGVPLGVSDYPFPWTDPRDGGFSTKPAFGVRAWAGWRFIPHLAGELELEWQATKFKTKIEGFERLEARPLVAMGNLKGYLLTGRVQPFVRVGVGYMDISLVENVFQTTGPSSTDFTVTPVGRTVGDIAAQFGGGIEYYATEHASVGVDFQYVMGFKAVDGFDYWSIGLFNIQYRF